MWYSSPLNLSMSWVNDFHDVDSYLSSLNLGMAELLKTLFQSYSHSVLLSHLYKKVLLFHHSHFLNLPFTLSILLSSCSHSPTCSQSPSQSHCTLIARFLKAGKYAKHVGAGALVYLSTVLEHLAVEVTKHCFFSFLFFFFFVCFVGLEFLTLGVWVFGYLGMVLIGGMKVWFCFFFLFFFFLLMINLVCFDLMNVV